MTILAIDDKPEALKDLIGNLQAVFPQETIAAFGGELSAIAKQHGNGTCLPMPITVERIQEATAWLHEPCLWEDEDCGEGCCWTW